MKRICLMVLLSCLLALPGMAAEPFARATVEDGGRIVPGQQVHVTVDVFTPNFFTSPPQFPLFDLPNAVVTLPDERAQNIVQTIDGVQYSGIRRIYAVVPETTGTFTLPAASIGFRYSDEQGQQVTAEVRLPPTRFVVGAGSKDATGSLAFVARNVSLAQSFDRDPTKLRTGEALVRTVTVFAEDSQAMLIPAVDLGELQGLKVYMQAPKLSDGVSGEDRIEGSTRTQTVTYVAETAGTFDIPAASLAWFDIDTHEAREASLPAFAMTVAQSAPSEGIAPQLQQQRPPPAPTFPVKTMLGAAIVTAVLLAAARPARRLLQHIARRLQSRRALRESSERAHFRRLLSALRRADALTVYILLGRWCRSLGFRSITAWTDRIGDNDLTGTVAALERELFGASCDLPVFDRKALQAAILHHRRISAPAVQQGCGSSLPELNPFAGGQM